MQPPHTRVRFVVLTLLVATGTAVPALAQSASWPAGSEKPIAANPPILTVAPFQAGGSTRLSVDTTAAMADELAAQLADGGRCRVLDQAWLPVRGGATNGLSIQTLRDAAASAGVDYLVVGNVVPVSRTMVIQPQVYRAPTLGGRRFGPSPSPMGRPTKIRRSFLKIRLSVVDVRTGKTMDSVVVESAVRGPTGAAIALLPIPGLGWAARAVVAAHAIARSSSTLDTGLREAMASAAQRISTSWVLQAGARQLPPDGRGGRS